jgi:hypothetical protein
VGAVGELGGLDATGDGLEPGSMLAVDAADGDGAGEGGADGEASATQQVATRPNATTMTMRRRLRRWRGIARQGMPDVMTPP